LLVVLVGPTGAGKSTVFNTIAGREARARPVVLRPTTRVAVVLVHPDDRVGLAEGTFARIPPSLVRFVEDATIERGSSSSTLRTSIRSSTRTAELTDRLIEAADLAAVRHDRDSLRRPRAVGGPRPRA
jgi:ABC-type branched-subunit amino acid transport system ATPase component